MDRGAWRATVHGVTGVGHNLATKQPPKAEQKTFSSDTRDFQIPELKDKSPESDSSQSRTLHFGGMS